MIDLDKNYKNAGGSYSAAAIDVANSYRNSGGFSGAGMLDFSSIANNHKNSNFGMANSYTRHNDSSKERDVATISGAAGGALAAQLYGVAGVGKALGLTSIGMGAASAPIVGIAMAVGGGALGGVALYKSGPYLAKAGKVAAKIGFKALNYGLKKSVEAIKKTHNSYHEKSDTKSKELDKVDTTTKQRESKFKGFVKDSRNKMMENRDIKDNLSQMYQLKIPTQNAKKELNNLAGDYFIKNNLKNGKLDLKSMKKDVNAFAKKTKLSRAESKGLNAGVLNRVEQHKDNLVFDKNSKISELSKDKREASKKTKESIKKDTQKVEKKKEKIKQKQEVKKEPQKQEQTKALQRGKSEGKEQGR
ncbi:MAG TPA: hypothetical protein EYG69_00200 [Campylobacterales bacterium]|nr:hypothetical protein [Campylobacterales bacterium]